MRDIAFQKALSSVMLDNKYDRFVKNRKTGKLDTKSLYKINTSDKLFKRREARKNKHYAVSLVVDVSSSMDGAKLNFAAEAAGKLSHHLSKIGIPNNVVIYGLGAIELRKFSAREDKTLEKTLIEHGSYGKYCLAKAYKNDEYVKNKNNGRDMYKHVATGYQRDDKNTEGIYSKYRDVRDVNENSVYTLTSLHGTSIGEAIRFSREKLLRQQGKKIMVFLTDGAPCPMGSSYESMNFPGYADSDFDPAHEIAMTLKSGIEYYGIGVLDDRIKDYSPPKRTASINNMNQLYPHIVHLIRKNLKRG